MTRKLLLAAFAALALCAPLALAADPAPAPCDGKLQAVDPAGDQTVGFAGNQSPAPAAESEDTIGLFMLRSADGKTSINLLMANASKSLPTGSAGQVFRFFWTQTGHAYYGEVDVDPTGADSYSLGHIDDTTGTLTSDGASTGQFIEGKNGVISLNLDADHGAKVGVKFTEAYAFTAYDEGAVLSAADFVPDGSGRVTWNGAVCGSAPGATPGATPPPGTTPAPGTGGGTPAGSSPKQATTTGPLLIAVSPKSFKAKKVKKAKKVAFTLSSKEQLKNVVVTLKKGAKKVSSAKLAQLTGKAKVSLKVKGLKKGKYTLGLSGQRADGSTGTLAVKIAVK